MFCRFAFYTYILEKLACNSNNAALIYIYSTPFLLNYYLKIRYTWSIVCNIIQLVPYITLLTFTLNFNLFSINVF